MATPDQIKQFIATLGKNPALIDELGKARNPHDVQALLVNHGLMSANQLRAGQPPFTRPEVTKEVITLLRAGCAPTPPAQGQRPVEWVGAVGQLVGAAAAGFCAA